MWMENEAHPCMPFTPTDISGYEEIYKDENWITRDGQVIRIKDMQKSHIANCINMIKRHCIARNLNPENYIVYNNLARRFNNMP